MRNANAVELKKYLRMRLSEDDVAQIERQRDIQMKVPGATREYDQWEEILRATTNRLEAKGMSLDQISNALYDKEEVTHVDLSHNNFTHIPDKIALLSQLHCMNFSNNQLRDLPRSIAQMSWLVELELNGNQLSDFFSDLGHSIRLDSLSYLNLNQNRFNQIPESLRLLPNLKTLHMAMNNIDSVQRICHPDFASSHATTCSPTTI